VFARVKYTVNVANLIALVIQIMKWTISFVPILLLNKKKKIPKISNFSKPLEIFGNISENFQKFPEIFPSRRTLFQKIFESL